MLYEACRTSFSVVEGKSVLGFLHHSHFPASEGFDFSIILMMG